MRWTGKRRSLSASAQTHNARPFFAMAIGNFMIAGDKSPCNSLRVMWTDGLLSTAIFITKTYLILTPKWRKPR